MNQKPTIGLLYPGELGSSLARAFVGQGLPVVSTLGGRSQQTRERAEKAGIRLLPDVAEVCRQAQIVLSVVPPAAALDVAEQVTAALEPGKPMPIYVDANSIAPATVRRIGELLATRGAQTVDAAVYGLAANLAAHGTVYLSGPAAEMIAQLWRGALRVEVVGPEIGQASAIKMLLGGLNKGLAALVFELGILAARSGMEHAFWSTYRRHYPGLMEVVDRVLPSYPRHAARRADELGELQQMMQAAGAADRIIASARATLANVAAVDWQAAAQGPQANWTAEEVIAALAAQERQASIPTTTSALT